jgi:hypothetical protein
MFFATSILDAHIVCDEPLGPLNEARTIASDKGAGGGLRTVDCSTLDCAVGMLVGGD